MLKARDFAALQKLAKGVAAQFGSDCEVVVHRLSADTMEHSIVAIENGHVTGRKVGDGPSHVVLERLGKTIDPGLNDHLCYLTLSLIHFLSSLPSAVFFCHFRMG